MAFSIGYTSKCGGGGGAERQRPELAPFAAFVRLWQDAIVPSSSQQSVDMSRASCTQQLFEFLEPKTGACGVLLRMCFFCYPATVSYGVVSDSTSEISDGSRMTARGLAGNLDKEDVAVHFNEAHGCNAPGAGDTEVYAGGVDRLRRVAACWGGRKAAGAAPSRIGLDLCRRPVCAQRRNRDKHCTFCIPFLCNDRPPLRGLL